MPPKKIEYSQKDEISHILDRPDTYVGSKRLKNIDEFICIKDFVIEDDIEEEKYIIVKKNIEYSPAILRIFVEVLSNAIDNVQRSKEMKIPCNSIKIHINNETGETSVWNDGYFIPIEINKEAKIHNHTLIFGNLRTGSNYDDEQERIISGRNGLGSKLSNVFSLKFIVKALDPDNNKIFEQTWTDNMRIASKPKINDTKLKTGYTKITYFPDFKQFGLKGYTDDIINLYRKYIIDASMLTKVKVYLNEELIPVNNLVQYSKLYDYNSSENLLIKTNNSEVLIRPSSINEFQAISFVNGVYTRVGGAHVDAFSEAIFRPIVEKYNKKKTQVNIKDIKQFFNIFVVSTVIKPEFSSQDKEKLEAPKIEAVIKQTDINKILKWSVIEDIEEMINMKDMSILKKIEKKKKGYTKIDKLDNANNAGGKLGYQCGLILCEGDSAKTFADAGIDTALYDKQGKDWYGIMTLGGKVLNIRNSIPSTIAKNKVITNLIQALNLRHDLDYTDDKNYKTLSYGKVIILTDSDVDGLHISGLVMNFFHHLFPSLLKREEPYIVSMCTPIVRIDTNKNIKDFYDENRFREYAKTQTESFLKKNSKYYKGLGTIKLEDVPDLFGTKMIHYDNDENTTKIMNKVFHKKFADSRKDWLENYNPISEFSLDDQGKIVNMKISKYLDNEVIKFSHDDCKRSIPSLFDGLKISQRKVLYAIKKRNLTFNKKSLKVAQLGGYVAEHANYHHGEQNLYDTIVKMAQAFVGSNNIPLFYRDGGFGSRRVNGQDAASARYIFTKMDQLTHLIFREEDDVLLDYLNDDGDIVEPNFYIPILPMILINGSKGIGTGWSCTIPMYNPKDIIECIKIWLENDGEVLLQDPEDCTIVSIFPELKPWYRGFTGEIETQNKNKFITKGIIKKDKTKVFITELPIGMSIDKFKENCEDWLVEKKIKNMKNNSSPNKVNFTLTETDDGFDCNINNLKLTSSISTTNMVLFNEKEQLKKYTIDQILNDFCEMRFEYYIKRKKYILKNFEKDLKIYKNKARFIQEIIDKKLNINLDEDIVIKELEKRGYDKDSKNDDIDDKDIDIENTKSGYNYLLNMNLRSLTTNKIKKLNEDIEKIKKQIEKIKNTTEKEMWINDLEEFEKEYEKWLKVMEAIENKKAKNSKKIIKLK